MCVIPKHSLIYCVIYTNLHEHFTVLKVYIYLLPQQILNHLKVAYCNFLNILNIAC